MKHQRPVMQSHAVMGRLSVTADAKIPRGGCHFFELDMDGMRATTSG